MWPDLIKHLQDAELTQAQIAERVGCSQPTIHRLLSGETLDPSFSVGVALIDIAKKLGGITREDLRPDLWPPEPARAKEPLAEEEENSHV